MTQPRPKPVIRKTSAPITCWAEPAGSADEWRSADVTLKQVLPAYAGVLESASALLGRPVVAAERGGASDASHMAAGGIELTIDGLGPRGGGAHAPHEWVSAESLRTRAEVALAALAGTYLANDTPLYIALVGATTTAGIADILIQFYPPKD